MFNLFKTDWLRAWIRDENGEVFRALYKWTGDKIVVRSEIGRSVEGHADGTTSHKQIAAWWPDRPDRRLIQPPLSPSS